MVPIDSNNEKPSRSARDFRAGSRCCLHPGLLSSVAGIGIFFEAEHAIVKVRKGSGVRLIDYHQLERKRSFASRVLRGEVEIGVEPK